MAEASNKRLISITILVLFIIFVSIPIIFILTGFMWYELTQGQIVLWLTLNTIGGSLSAGIVAIYSLERYKQEQLFTYLLLVMVCITEMITGVLYLITSPAFTGLSPFVDLNRNRFILMFGAITLAASPLLGSLVSETPIQQQEKLLLILLNCVVGPIIQVWVLLSPVQLFNLASGDLGPFQFTPGGFVLFTFLVVLLIMSLIKSLRAYYISRVSIHLALGLLMAITMVAGILVAMAAGPRSVAEGSWYSVYIEGFVIISISFMLDVVVDPFRNLRALVKKRTEELAESKRESEYYLNIWSHKVGNLLQEVQLHLELLNMTSGLEEIKKLSQSSLLLVDDVEAINRQVRVLSRIKSRQNGDLFPVSMREVIKTAIHDIIEVSEDINPEITFSESGFDSYVLADELLITIPFNIIMYIIRSQSVGRPKIDVSLSESPDDLKVCFQYEGKHIPRDILAALQGSLDPLRTTLGLDIYAVNVLLKDYGGTFVYENSPHGGQFIASIKKSLTNPPEKTPEKLQETIDT